MAFVHERSLVIYDTVDTVEKHQARLVPPFFKGGLGGIWGYQASTTIKQNPPRPPFRKGGRKRYAEDHPSADQTALPGASLTSAPSLVCRADKQMAIGRPAMILPMLSSAQESRFGRLSQT